VPDSSIARQATELLRDASSDLLFRHSLRVYFWGARSMRGIWRSGTQLLTRRYLQRDTKLALGLRAPLTMGRRADQDRESMTPERMPDDRTRFEWE
jgi:hypothetical protein